MGFWSYLWSRRSAKARVSYKYTKIINELKEMAAPVQNINNVSLVKKMKEISELIVDFRDGKYTEEDDLIIAKHNYATRIQELEALLNIIQAQIGLIKKKIRKLKSFNPD